MYFTVSFPITPLTASLNVCSESKHHPFTTLIPNAHFDTFNNTLCTDWANVYMIFDTPFGFALRSVDKINF